MRPPLWWGNNKWFNSARVVLIGWMFAGISLLAEPFLRVSVNPALEASVTWVKLMISLGISLGAALLLLSRLKWSLTSTSWRLEIVGLPLLTIGWVFYTATIIVYDNWSLFPIALGISFTIACIQRFFELLHQADNTRKNVEHLPEVGNV